MPNLRLSENFPPHARGRATTVDLKRTGRSRWIHHHARSSTDTTSHLVNINALRKTIERSES